MARVSVIDPSAFQDSLAALKGKTHGDTLALFLGLRFHLDRLPRVGTPDGGVTSNELETLLDTFYTKVHQDLGRNSGMVCRLFHSTFTQSHSYEHNNWRDFFRYALGVGCLASEELLASDFLVQPRDECPHLAPSPGGGRGCALHPIRTKYIRALTKPKLLHWSDPGHKGTYKVVDLKDRRLLEVVRPLCERVPIESLIVALYFGAQWHKRQAVGLSDFAEDFGFDSVEDVEYLFAVDPEDPAVKRKVAKRLKTIRDLLDQEFVPTEPKKTALTFTERRVRDLAFREIVCQTYGNACAVCELKVEARKGHWEVQAAHIIEHKKGGSDDVRNGLALCHNHHWAFDELLFTVDKEYRLVWRTAATKTGLHFDRELRLPADRRAWPNQEYALESHRIRFRREKDRG